MIYASSSDSVFFSRPNPPFSTPPSQSSSSNSDGAVSGARRRGGVNVYFSLAGSSGSAVPSSESSSESLTFRRRLPYNNASTTRGEEKGFGVLPSVPETRKERIGGGDSGYRYGSRSITRSHRTSSLTDLPINIYDVPSQGSTVSRLVRRGKKWATNAWDGAKTVRIDAFRIELLLIRLAILAVLYLSITTVYDSYFRDRKWEWSVDRKRNGRQCAIHFFIEKYAPDEFDPDLLEVLPDKLTRRQLFDEEETHRTKGQFTVITRLIASVATTFRIKTSLNQHIIFTGTRDGGHLAEAAMKHWPRRGNYHTQLHVVAADSDENSGAGDDPLKYSNLHSVEERFNGKKHVQIYDRHGLAGISDDDDDDMTETPDHSAVNKKRHPHSNSTDLHGQRQPYPNLQSFLPSDDPQAIIPYLHVDGKTMADQLEILETARPLFVSKTVIVVSVEHSADMNIYRMLDFFDSVNYKTFFLGTRQLARIDNLCPEILNDVLHHPAVSTVDPNGKPIKKQLATMLGNNRRHLGKKNRLEDRSTPPFLVAMPRGRPDGAEMTIQHSYDLFGGLDDSTQLTTANDRSIAK